MIIMQNQNDFNCFAFSPREIVGKIFGAEILNSIVNVADIDH